jgi:outer membrane receptor for ferrienterochelin and colicins
MRTKSSAIIWVLMALCGAGWQTGQAQSIAGLVQDAQTGEPLHGAVIAWNTTKIQTGRDGRFNLPTNAGAGTIITSMVGYKKDTLAISDTTVTTLVISLQRLSRMLDDIVITGTMKAVQKTASPVPVEVYTPQFFKRNPTPTIFDALQQVNGVRPQLNCNVCNTGDIHINGLEGPYTMVLIDGMPIVSSLSSVYGLSGIPNSLVERIEVVKGPASSLYGSEAIGGLINVITKNPAKAPLLSVDVSSTTWNELNVDAGIKYRPFKKTTGLLGINYFNFQNRVDKNNDHFTDVTLQHRISAFNKLSFERNNNRIANIAGRFIYEDRWGGDMNWNKHFRGGDSLYGESIYTARLELIGNYQLPVAEKFLFSWSFNSHSQRSAYGNTLFNALQQIGFGQLTWDKTLGKHDLLVGTVLRYTDYDDNTTATMDTFSLKNRPDRTWLPGVLVQDEIGLNAQQKLLLGARWDHHPIHGNIFTPRVAWKISPTANDVIRLNAGTGFRVVNLFTEDHAALTGARNVVIQEELKPERSYNVNVNYVKKFYTAGYWLNIDASVWYTYFTNRILPDYTTNVNQIMYDNLNGYSKSKGLSINTEFGVTSSLRGHAGITLQDVTITEKNNEGKKQQQRQLLTERWSGTWSFSYTFSRPGITVDYTGNIYGPMLLPLLGELDPRPAKSPVWSIQNIQLTKKIGHQMEIYGGIKNLLNWTPAKKAVFIIARSHDPFDKEVSFDANGNALSTASNPYALTFDPNYVYAANQGMRGFLGFRYSLQGNKKQ